MAIKALKIKYKSIKKISAIFILTVITLLNFNLTFANNHSEQLNFNIRNENNLRLQDIKIEMDKGTTYQNLIKIENPSNEQFLNLKIYATDAIKTNDGKIGYKLDQDVQNHIGEWIEFKNENIQINPGQTLTVPYFVNIPSYATPGTYAGAINFELNNQDSSQDQVVVKARKAKPIFLNIKGEKNIQYILQEFSFDQNSNSFNVSVKNLGNSYLIAENSLIVKGDNFNQAFETQNLSLLQSESNQSTFEWIKNPEFGFYTAELTTKIYDLNLANNQKVLLEEIKRTISIPIIPYNQIIIGVLILISLATIYIIHKILLNIKLKNAHPYTVSKGENIKSIAQKHKLNWKYLAHINHIKAPYTLRENQIIKIPKNEKKA